MTEEWLWVLRGIEGSILVVGLIISALSWRAYRRTRDASLLFLGAGFLLVSAAAAVAGVLYELLTHDLLSAWTISSSFNLIGFLAILYSIYHVGPRAVSGNLGGSPPAPP